ncbi:MAG: hypothetical protein HOY44_09630 [Maritimibacter sp.]|uniref:hypothetical protein n=1 Tax=Maritimibacter sp. TaxID=2003363 RepID=UPI001E1AE770|nr:hypothetical protein [Maritimibacter sp.]MBL6427772.1 hypothetical protein [Maritimibacter sp.]
MQDTCFDTFEFPFFWVRTTRGSNCRPSLREIGGIVNEANKTMNNPAYPLELFQRVITVSLETMKIVNALPKLDLPKRRCKR